MHQTAIATTASRNTSLATSVASQPLTPVLPKFLTETLYQLKKTLTISTTAPPSEIHTDRDTLAKSKLDVADGPAVGLGLDW
jgi:hypothetical protein